MLCGYESGLVLEKLTIKYLDLVRSLGRYSSLAD
jgi:hypothetical protein